MSGIVMPRYSATADNTNKNTDVTLATTPNVVTAYLILYDVALCMSLLEGTTAGEFGATTQFVVGTTVICTVSALVNGPGTQNQGYVMPFRGKKIQIPASTNLILRNTSGAVGLTFHWSSCVVTYDIASA